MRTRALFFFLIITNVSLLKAQTLPSFTHDADSVFQNLDKSYITTGILYDRVYPWAMLHVFNTANFDTTNVYHFIQGYYELYNAKYTNTNLISPKAVDRRIDAIKKTGKIPVGIINFQFNQIDTNALADNLLESRNGIYYDVSNRKRSPYRNKQVSIISPLTDSTEGLEVSFQTSSNLYLQNTGHTIISLRADFNNGSGLTNMGLNNTTTISYTSYGKKVIKFIIKYQDNTQVTTYAYLKMVKPNKSAVNILATTCDKDDYITASIPFTDYENNTFKGQGNIHYYFATNSACNGKVKKPIIILDGYDPGDQRSISQIYNYLNNVGGYALADDIRSKGYDIVILNFPIYKNEFDKIIDGGADYIERNAFVLIKLINKINRELKDNGSSEKLVIIGPSMGGLISRYAFAYMEKNNRPHNTRLWISLDAPHNGANIPIGLQKYLEFFAGNGIKDAKESLERQVNSPAAKQQLLHHYLSYSVLAKGAPGFRNKFDSALTDNGLAGSNGFPVMLRKIALIDGSLNGSLQPNSSACQLVLNSKTYFAINTLFLFRLSLFKIAEASIYFAGSYANPCTVLSAKQLFEGSVVANGSAPANSVSYDIAPGGSYSSLSTLANQGTGSEVADNTQDFINPILARFFQFPLEAFSIYTKFKVYNGSHSFIPTKSALAFSGTNQDLAENVYDRNLVCTGETPFDTYYGGTVNLIHSFIDPAMANFAVDEISGKHHKPSYVTSLSSLYISGPDKFCEPGGIYSLKGGDISEGTNLAWSVSPAIASISSGKYSEQVQLSRISNGTATLSLTLNRACGLNQTLTKIFTIGGYSSEDYPVTGPSSSCANQYVHFSTNQLPGATDYTWFWPSEWTYVSGQGTYSLSLKTGTSSGGVGVRVANACDAGGSPAIKSVQINCGLIVATSPNPSSGDITITTEQTQSLKAGTTKDKIYRLEIIDLYGTIKRNFIYSSGVNNIKINLSNLVNGTYLIHAFNGKIWGYKKIIILH